MENRRSKNDTVSKRIWKAVKTSTKEVRMGKTEKRGSKRRSKKKMRRERQEKEIEKRKDHGSKESSRKVGNLG